MPSRIMRKDFMPYLNVQFIAPRFLMVTTPFLVITYSQISCEVMVFWARGVLRISENSVLPSMLV